MLLLLALLLVVVFAGLGFAVHLLWILAAVFLVVFLVAAATSRGQRAGTH
jgi:hypothetical protein